MAETPGIRIDETRREGAVVLSPRGEIDMDASVAFRTALQQALRRGSARLVVDLEEVAYMDSAGLATLVEAMRDARRDNRSLMLCGLNDRVRGIFEIARLDHYFTILETVDDALAQ